MKLAVRVARDLIQEFQCRQRDFRYPFPDAQTLVVSAKDFASWEDYAVRGVQEMLQTEILSLQMDADI